MKTLKERIAIEQAKLDGANIEWIQLNGLYNGWRDFNPDPDAIFAWHDCDYRIKPKLMEFWVNVWSDRETNLCWESKENAEAAAHGVPGYIKSVKFREVIE